MINKYLKIIIVLLLVANATFAGNKIGIYDLRYTLQADLSTAQGLNLAWDDVHAVATLQGVVNRDTPRLYVYFVMEGNNDIDGYWWNKYSISEINLSDKQYTNIKIILYFCKKNIPL